MSNGSRLVAVIVVVVLAAIGLYFAFLYNPDKVPAPVSVPVNTNLPQGTITAPAPGGPLDETKSGTTGGDAMKPITAPPAGAFAPPSGAAATGVAGHGSPTTGASGAALPGATPGTGSPTTPSASGGNRPGNSVGGPTPVGVTPPASSASERAPAPTPSIEYTVRAGDTLEGLSRRFLDDGSKWQSIVAANPGLSPTSLKIGQKIAIPTSKSASAAPSAGGSASAPAGSGASTAGNTYTVLKGDTLMGIARKVYGSDSDWRKILEANATQLRGDATAIQPGMKLSIPAKR